MCSFHCIMLGDSCSAFHSDPTNGLCEIASREEASRAVISSVGGVRVLMVILPGMLRWRELVCF